MASRNRFGVSGLYRASESKGLQNYCLEFKALRFRALSLRFAALAGRVQGFEVRASVEALGLMGSLGRIVVNIRPKYPNSHCTSGSPCSFQKLKS